MNAEFIAREQDAIPSNAERLGAITTRPVLGGLHHRYYRA